MEGILPTLFIVLSGFSFLVFVANKRQLEIDISRCLQLLEKEYRMVYYHYKDSKSVMELQDRLRDSVYKFQRYDPNLPIVETVEALDRYCGDLDSIRSSINKLTHYLVEIRSKC